MRYESFYPFNNHVRQQALLPRQTFFPNPNQSFQPNFPNQNINPIASGNFQQQTGQQTSNLENYMKTADRFLSTAQQYAPVIQQFAPMISNLPSMWRLYKGVQSMPNRSPATSNQPPATPQSFPSTQNFSTTEVRPSVPRIFQPDNPIL